MKNLLIAGALALTLSGCAGMNFPIPGGSIPFTSNPLASALRQCAMFAELLTPGINLAAAAEIARSAAADNALGNTPQGAMRNCAKLLDSIAD